MKKKSNPRGPVETVFNSDECMSILDVTDKIFITLIGIVSGDIMLPSYSLKLEDFCGCNEDKKAIKKLRKAGRFYVPKRKVKN
jgi:hypothetical protein